jgi:hypothetical protein
MLISSTSPIPANTLTPIPLSNRDELKRLALDAAVAKALSASFCSANPNSFALFGPNIVADVAQQLNYLNSIGQGIPVNIAAAATNGGTSTQASAGGVSPIVVPLNPEYLTAPVFQRKRSPVQSQPAWGDAAGGPALSKICNNPVGALIVMGLLGYGLYLALEG